MKAKLALMASVIALSAHSLGSSDLLHKEDKSMDALTPDQAAVITIIESVGVLADRSEFDALARLYADEFSLNYASLNGQQTTTKSPLALMNEWSSVLPGFDRTRHALSNIKAETNKQGAIASANVVASHWIGDQFWQVSGRYDYQLIKDADGWKITAMTFTLEDEVGSRDVFEPAMKAAVAKALSGNKRVTAARNTANVRMCFIQIGSCRLNSE